MSQSNQTNEPNQPEPMEWKVRANPIYGLVGRISIEQFTRHMLGRQGRRR